MIDELYKSPLTDKKETGETENNRPYHIEDPKVFYEKYGINVRIKQTDKNVCQLLHKVCDHPDARRFLCEMWWDDDRKFQDDWREFLCGGNKFIIQGELL